MEISRTAIPLLANAVYLITEKSEFIESRSILNEGATHSEFWFNFLYKSHTPSSYCLVNGLRPDWFSCQKYLAVVNLKLRANSLAESYARQSKSSLLLIRSLVQQNLQGKLNDAVDQCKLFEPKVTAKDKTEFLELYAT